MRICNAEEYEPQSTSVKTTPKFENRLLISLFHPSVWRDFRIWTRFLRKHVHFRVIHADINPYCTLAQCMIENEQLGMKSYKLLDLQHCSAVLKCLITPPSHLSDQHVFQSFPAL